MVYNRFLGFHRWVLQEYKDGPNISYWKQGVNFFKPLKGISHNHVIIYIYITIILSRQYIYIYTIYTHTYVT